MEENKITQIDKDLRYLCLKQKWNPEDVAEFWKLRKEKYWPEWSRDSARIFYEIRKQHTRCKSELVRSWKECNVKFHNAWFESLHHDWRFFEWFKIPFTLYHQDIVDCDIVTIVGVRWRFKRRNNVYYICSWEHQGMWLLAKEAPEPFSKLKFDDRGLIDFVEKDWKFIDCSWERKAYQIYRDED